MTHWLDHPLHCDCVDCAAPEPRYAGKRGTARSLIERLTRRGVSFRLVDGKVRFRPASRLSEEERAELRRVRDETRQLIREDDERRRRGEGNVRDQGEVFEMARRSKNGRGAA